MRTSLMAGIGLILLGICGTAAAESDPQDREIAALKKENELLKKEVELMKKELEQLKGQAGDKAKQATVTLDDVEYEFISIKRNGNNATMRLGITSKKGDPRLLHQLRVRLIGKDGQEHVTPIGSSGGKGDQSGVRLFEGTRREIDFDLGKLPSDMNEISTIIIPGKGGVGFSKARQNPVLLKGKFNVE